MDSYVCVLVEGLIDDCGIRVFQDPQAVLRYVFHQCPLSFMSLMSLMHLDPSLMHTSMYARPSLSYSYTTFIIQTTMVCLPTYVHDAMRKEMAVRACVVYGITSS